MPVDNAISIIDECQIINNFTVADFGKNYTWEDIAKGVIDPNVIADSLYEKGLNYLPSENPVVRRSNVLNSCKRLENDFEDYSKWVPTAKRGPLWWTNLIGILLEFIGAALIVWAAYRNKKLVSELRDTWDGKPFEQLRDVMATQAFTELRGFLLLATGLVFQMLGSFNL